MFFFSSSEILLRFSLRSEIFSLEAKYCRMLLAFLNIFFIYIFIGLFLTVIYYNIEAFYCYELFWLYFASFRIEPLAESLFEHLFWFLAFEAKLPVPPYLRVEQDLGPPFAGTHRQRLGQAVGVNMTLARGQHPTVNLKEAS